jgi:hypothetical protein
MSTGFEKKIFSGKREGRRREEKGKREWEKPLKDLFPTLFSLCLSLCLLFVFPEAREQPAKPIES